MVSKQGLTVAGALSISTYRSLLIMFYGDGEVPASVNPKENKEKPTAAMRLLLQQAPL